MAGPSNFAINNEYPQPVGICAYNSALNPDTAWLLTSFVHLLTALCAHTGLATVGETSHLLVSS